MTVQAATELSGISLEDSNNEDSCVYEKVDKDEEYVTTERLGASQM
jgi:hypothetical protein